MVLYKSVNGNLTQHQTQWNVWITEAKRQLKDLKEREVGLRVTIARLEQFRDSGEPWPVQSGYTVTQNEQSATHQQDTTQRPYRKPFTR